MKKNVLEILSKKYNENPYAVIESLDRSEAIVFDETLNAKVAISYSTVKELLSKKEIFTTEPLAARAEPVMRGKVLAQMHGEEHKNKRLLITRQITGGVLKEYYFQHLAGLCDIIIENLSKKNEFDFITEFGKTFSMLSTFKILGIDDSDLDFYHERLRLIVKFATGFNLSKQESDVYISAAIEMEKSILALIERKRVSPGNDLVSFIIKQGDEDISKKLESNEIVALTLNVLLAASEPVDKVLSVCIYHLFRNEQYLDGILSGVIKSNDILQETLRITPPVHLIPRLAVEDYITEKGDAINKGEIVYMLLSAANRDPDFFNQPDEFKPEREFKGHLSYGSGIHTCIDAQFANMQLNVALEKLSPLLKVYQEKYPPVFDGIYTRGAVSYILERR